MNKISSLLYFIGERIRSYDAKPEAYPIGSYYWTSDSTFSPATTFGGTWEMLDEGIVLVSAGTNYPISSGTAKDGGEATHTLTVAEMPSHNHPIVINVGWGAGSLGDGNGRVDSHKPANLWPASSFNTGGSQPHNIMQPYKNAYCWHRTA